MVTPTLSQCSSIQLKSSLLLPKTRFFNSPSPSQMKETTVVTKRCIAVSLKASSSSSMTSVKKNNDSVIVIDNYDSFTYNLCQYIGELGCNFEVYRNDEITVDELRKKNPRGIVISPGADRGISAETIVELGPTVPVFGVCLGLQCIGEAFGGKLVRSPSGPVLGRSSLIYYNDDDGEEGLFAGLPNPFAAARYHRFVIGKDNFPSDALEITAWTEDGLIMAARHKVYTHLLGVQFHPESIITNEGKKIVGNFIKLIERMETDSET